MRVYDMGGAPCAQGEHKPRERDTREAGPLRRALENEEGAKRGEKRRNAGEPEKPSGNQRHAASHDCIHTATPEQAICQNCALLRKRGSAAAIEWPDVQSADPDRSVRRIVLLGKRDPRGLLDAGRGTRAGKPPDRDLIRNRSDAAH
jgi:hypothetical protein